MSTDAALHVIFGTGPVGMAVIDELVNQGKQVRIVNRSGKANAPSGVEVLAGDATDSTFATKACEGADVVYNALNPPYDKWPELFPKVQAGVLEGAAAADAKLVVMENLYMYGHSHGKPLTEDMPYNADTRKGKVRAQMSRDLMDAHEKGKVRVAIGRASDFVGPRAPESAMGNRVIENALKGKAASVLGNPDMLHTYTYVPDVGKALVKLGECDEALGQAWHIPAAETLTTRQFIERIYQEAGHPVKISPAPKFILTILGLFNPIIREVNEMVYEFEEPWIVDHSKYVNAFGNHATPIDEVIRATVQWFRDHPSSK